MLKSINRRTDSTFRIEEGQINIFRGKQKNQLNEAREKTSTNFDDIQEMFSNIFSAANKSKFTLLQHDGNK